MEEQKNQNSNLNFSGKFPILFHLELQHHHSNGFLPFFIDFERNLHN